jgi:hypothetical protein
MTDASKAVEALPRYAADPDTLCGLRPASWGNWLDRSEVLAVLAATQAEQAKPDNGASMMACCGGDWPISSLPQPPSPDVERQAVAWQFQGPDGTWLNPNGFSRRDVDLLKYPVRLLYTTPPKEAGDADAEDAARYRWLRDTPWFDTPLQRIIALQLNAKWDAAIDAARSLQQKARP